MSTRYKFYMVRLSGGIWEPKIKYSNLAKASNVAFEMAKFHGKRATVLASFSSVEVIDGKPVWIDQTPER